MTTLRAEPDLIGMLKAAASRRPPVADAGDAKSYDWNKPLCFTATQMGKLHGLAQDAAGKLSAALGQMFHTPMQVAAVAPELGNYDAMRKALAAGGGYCAVADVGGQPGGVLWLPTESALGFIARLLGGAPGASEQRDLSALESDLLLDVLTVVVKSFGQAFGPKTALQARREIIKADSPVAGLQDCCQFAFKMADQEKPCMALLVSCRFIEAACNWAPAPRPPEETRKLLAEHLDRAMMKASVWLRTSPFSLKQVLAIEAGDVLLLPSRPTDPVIVVVQERPVAAGRLASSDDRYAVAITGRIKP